LRSVNDSFSVDWSNDYDNTITVTRSVNAQSFKVYSADLTEESGLTESFEYARSWVNSRFDGDVRDSPSLGGYPILSLPASYVYVNSQVSEQFDKLDGSYGITVRWLYAPNITNNTYCSDDYSINKNQIYASGKTSYKISGTIKGYQSATRTTTASTAAKNYFETLTNSTFKNRINAAFNVAVIDLLGPIVNNYVYSPFTGTVTYDL
jgi:hypothetical protein